MGRPAGSENKDKPFAAALRMEIAAAGKDHKALREIARNLIQQARRPGKDALQAIQQIADRLDGKPAQAIEHQGEIEHRYVARLPEKAATTDAWQKQHAPTNLQ